MLTALKFVAGGVAKKDFQPGLTHFHIAKGRVTGYDGSMGLSAPIQIDIDCKPKAESMVRAIANCGDALSIGMTASGRLRVKSGGFSAMVDCDPTENTPTANPKGELRKLTDDEGNELYNAFLQLMPLVGNDASRPWSNGVLIDGPMMYVTNNVILANVWTGVKLPTVVCVPLKAVKEIVRVKQSPIAVQLSGTSITFHYADHRWIYAQVLDAGAWPRETIARLLDIPPVNTPTSFHPDFFDNLRSIKPFCDPKLPRVFIGNQEMRTHPTKDEGATSVCLGLNYEGIFGPEMVLLLEGVAQSIDWSAYPKPCPWRGHSVRGVIIGQRA